MKILYVYGFMASFTRSDLEILRSEHEVRALHFRRDPLHLPGSIVAALRGALWADAIVAWFGSIHALVPFLAGRLLGRRCYIIAGGYDVADEPAIAYGNLRGGPQKMLGRLIFRLADRVLAVSEAAAKETAANAGVPAGRIDVIVHGIADVGRPPGGAGEAPPRRGAITVSLVNESNLSRKGLATFVEAARHLPDVPFVLVGPWDGGAADTLRATASANVEFTGWVSDEEVRARMEAAGVYVQVSYHEAFGVALAEAMLCGCVPVVTERGSLPEVVGDTGLYVPFADAAATARAIATALASPDLGARARERILHNFPPALRRRRLLEAMQGAVTDGGHTGP